MHTPTQDIEINLFHQLKTKEERPPQITSVPCNGKWQIANSKQYTSLPYVSICINQYSILLQPKRTHQDSQAEESGKYKETQSVCNCVIVLPLFVLLFSLT